MMKQNLKTDGISMSQPTDRIEALKPMLSARQVAIRLSCSKDQVYNLARRGLIPATFIGDLVRFDPDLIEQWIKDGGAKYPDRDRIYTRERD